MHYGGFAADYFKLRTWIAWVSWARSIWDFSDINMCAVSPNLPRFHDPRIEALKYAKEHLYSGEFLFHLKSQVFENQVKINSDELRRYVSQDIWSNSWKSTENTFNVLCRFTLLCLLKWYNAAIIESFCEKCGKVALSTWDFLFGNGFV